jgi:pheromone shutdown protein TraB
MDDELRALFPEGYRIALPERSVGMAISETADEQVNTEFVMVVRNCHRDGTTPMVGEMLHPIDLMPDVKSN